MKELSNDELLIKYATLFKNMSLNMQKYGIQGMHDELLEVKTEIESRMKEEA